MIREAESADQSAIQRLYQLLIPNGPVNVLPERIAQIKNDPHNFLFIHETEGAITGTVFFTICLSPMFGFQPYGMVENFVVDENYRGQGIGTALINHVFKTGREHRCFAVKLLSSSSREAAHHFFERNGFNGTDKKGFIKYLNRER